MSLINQALKLEQQRRQASSGTLPPMATRLYAGRRSDRMPVLLVGFTAMGMLLAASVTAIFYFGSEYLDTGNKAIASSAETPSAPASASDSTASDLAEPALETLLGALSGEQQATVQQMLLEKQGAATESADAERATAPDSATLAERARIQEQVDGYSVQGIRKAGQATRVFLNGKIQRLGDVLDLETGLTLIGFTDQELVFEDSQGFRYQKSL